MRLLVIDGNSIANRAFFGIKLLTTKDGRYTNAIYGFMNILLNLLQGVRPRRGGGGLRPEGPHLPPQDVSTATRPPATACPKSWPSRCRC